MGFTQYAKTSPFLMGGLTPDKGDVHSGDRVTIIGTATTQSFGSPVLQAFTKEHQKPLKLTGKSCAFLAERVGDDESKLKGAVLTLEVTNTPKGPTITVVEVVLPPASEKKK